MEPYYFCRVRLSCAKEWFNKLNPELFSDIENVYVYFDDIFIATTTETEHYIAFKFLQRAREKLVLDSTKKSYSIKLMWLSTWEKLLDLKR